MLVDGYIKSDTKFLVLSYQPSSPSSERKHDIVAALQRQTTTQRGTPVHSSEQNPDTQSTSQDLSWGLVNQNQGCHLYAGLT